MKNEFYKGSAALTLDDGQKALICFDYVDDNRCENFDGEFSTETFSSNYAHWGGALGFYQEKPTTVGSYRRYGGNKVETLGSSGWTSLPDIPMKKY